MAFMWNSYTLKITHTLPPWFHYWFRSIVSRNLWCYRHHKYFLCPHSSKSLLQQCFHLTKHLDLKKKIKMKFKVQMGTLSSKYDTTVYSPYWKKSLIPGASGTVISFVLAQRLWLCNFLQGLHIYLGGGGSEGTTCQSCTKQINNGRYSRIGTLSSIYLGTKLQY